MRLWSLHPQYLDPQGLVALWREGLLAKKVLEGKTKGYRNHPQLERFKISSSPIKKINQYLNAVCDEADRRGYNFDRTKLKFQNSSVDKITVTNKQMNYEWQHLLKKQFKRSRKSYLKIKSTRRPKAHPLFKVIIGEIEGWEKR